ncbi:hypothetical protein ZWY2020_036686 [Hordeum vulgare]|nr:hypothetical protein ZWY2020_036686 [Hordeum vulgare]
MMHSIVGPMSSSKEPLGFNTPDVLVEPMVEVFNVVAKVAQTKATLLSLEDFRSKVTCPLPQSLLGTRVPSHGEKNDGHRSGRLDKKNKVCNIPTFKHAKHRMLEAFGELSEVSNPEQKMQAYLDMYKKPLPPQVIEALNSLTRIVEVKVGPLRMVPTR